jgi:hypothetical protein
MSGTCYCALGWFENVKILRIPFIKNNGTLGNVPDQRTGPVKEDEEVTDPKSTGRKRAVLVKPITEGMVCEWANLKFAGGGIYPVIGCPGNPATNIHHGPDKNTLNNDLTNLHAICSPCHNRWHTRNDPTYPEDIPGNTWIPNGDWRTHDNSTMATIEEVLEHETYWNLSPKQRELIDVRNTR